MNKLMPVFLLSLSLTSFSAWAATTTTTAPAGPSNQPPDYKASSTVGAQIYLGENSLMAWQKSAVGELADYSTYTETVKNDAFVNKVIEDCMEEGNLTKKCLFAGGKTGLKLLSSSLLGIYGFDDPDPNKPKNRNRAVSYVKNVTFSLPSYPGDAKVFKNKDKQDKLTEEGYAYFGQIFRQLPMVSAAQNAMIVMVGDRTRLAGLSAGLPVGANNAASVLEMMRYEATRRFANPSWYAKLSDPAQTTERAVLTEVAYLLAFQNYMMVKTYEQNAQTQALLVGQLSSINSVMGQVSQAGSSVDQKEIQKQIDKQT